MSASTSRTAATNSSAFNISLQNLHQEGKLTPKELQDFQFTSLDDLHTAIQDIQQKQVQRGNLQCLIRIQPFLVAMVQYGKIIEVFLNTNDILAFVWGPIKFILQTASAFGSAFELILDTYQSLGECLPQFTKYEALFRKHPQMQKALEYIYKDILDFHRRVLRIFKYKSWIVFFKCSWQGLTMQIQTMRENFNRHKGVLESQANLAHFEEAKIAREHAIDAQLKAEKREQQRLIIDIDTWLAPAVSKSDHEKYLDVQHNYPNTGRWLFRARPVKRWLDPSCSEVPIVWLYGIPGAGKTVLASVVVESLLQGRRRKASLAPPNPNHRESIAFFYCRHGNPERDNFLVVAASLISQLIQQDPEMAPLIYEMMSRTGGVRLGSHKDAQEYLEYVLTGTSATIIYLVIDGLDECDTKEMTTIVTTLTTLARSLNATSPGVFRLFFTSRNETAIKRLLSSANAAKMAIKPKDNHQDMKMYISIWFVKIQEKFALSDSQRQELEESVISRANGMFLFCTLVLQNLYGQSTKADFYNEMRPDTFPSGLEEAYGRIIQRLHNNFTPSQKRSAFQIMGLLVSVKRPLKKYEIQGFCSMDEGGNVDYENNSLRDDIKYLCGSLVESCPGDIIEFVHTTVKLYITQKLESLMSSWGEKNITTMCLAHLNTCCYDPFLNEDQFKEFVLQGCYSTLDYLTIHWIDHVRAYVAGCSRDEVKSIIPSLQRFFERHSNDPPEDSPLATTSTHRISNLHNAFKNLNGSPEIVEKLLGLISVRDGSTDPPLARNKLGAITHRVHSALEQLYVNSTESEKAKLSIYYGTHSFRCPEQDCAYFNEGFSTRQARDEHRQKHNRRLFCPEPGCYMGTISCSSASALKAHMEKDHHAMSQLPAQHANRRMQYPKFKPSTTPNRTRITDTVNFPSSRARLPASQPLENIPPWLEVKNRSEMESLVQKQGLAPGRVEEGEGWFAIFNPEIPQTLEVEYLHTITTADVNPLVVKFSHDGRYLAVGRITGAAIFDTDTGVLVTKLERMYPIFSLCFSPDDRLLATGSEKLLKIWNVASGSCERVFEGHQNDITQLDFARGPHGLRLATASRDRTARVWTLDDSRGLPISIFETDSDESFYSVSFSPDARLMAVGSSGGSAYIWDISKSCVLAKLAGHGGIICSISFTHTYELYTGGFDSIKRWLLIDGGKPEQSMTRVMCVRTSTGHKNIVSSLVVTPSMEFLFSGSTGGASGEVQICDPETGMLYMRLVHDQPCFRISIAVSCKPLLDTPSDYLFAIGNGVDTKLMRLKKYSPRPGP